MVRQLYRIYLYVVSLALLVFAAVGLALLLDMALAFTPLRGSGRPAPSGSQLTQQVVFAAVAWIVAALLGGLHYRLIRRDLASDPDAGSGAVRAFFLNLAQAGATLIAAFTGMQALSSLASRDPTYTPDSAGLFAWAITAAAVVVLLQLERRRTRAAPGVAATFQRLHLYGVPLVLLVFTGLATWDAAVKTTLTALLLRAGLYNPLDPSACAPSFGPVAGPCALPDVGLLWLATLVPAAAVGLYALLVRDDSRSVLRTVAHLGGLGYGVALVLVGLDRAAELAWRGAFAIPVRWSDVAHPWNAPYNFVSPLTAGVLLVLSYGWWLRMETALLSLGRETTGPTVEALAGALCAVPFFWGAGLALFTTFEAWGGARPTVGEWATALGLVVAGGGYLPLALHLRAQAEVESAGAAPHRAFVLALLAGGIVAGAVGLAVSLYALGTWLLGAPLLNWEQTARAGAAALVVGAALTGVYGWIALRGRLIEPLVAGLGAGAHAPPAAAPGAAPAESRALVESIEGVLDAYAAHRVEREQAAERILELTHTP